MGKAGAGGSFTSLLQIVELLNKNEFTITVILYYNFDIIEEYRRNGCDVIVINKYTAGSQSAKNVESYANLSLLRKAVKTLSLPSIKSLVNIIRRWKRISAVCEVIKTRHIDILHCNDRIGSNIEGIVAAFLTRVPLILHQRRHDYGLSKLIFHLANRAHKFIAVSESVRENLLENSFDSRKVVLLNDWVNSTQLPVPTKNNVNHRKTKLFTISSIGCISEHKGQHLLIEAAGIIKEKGLDFQVLIFGSPENAQGDKYLNLLKQKVTIHGLERNIIFKGYVQTKDIYEEGIDLLVHTPVAPEPFGRIVIESMMYHIAVVASGEGGVLDIIEHRKNGLLFEPGNVEKLVDMICLLKDDDDFRAALAQAGYRTVCEKFTEKGRMEQLLEIYNGILPDS